MESVTTLKRDSSLARSQSLELARCVFEDQARALDAVGGSLNGEFLEAVDLILSCTGKVIVCGMGKSGIIGRKIAATLSSTGTSSFFVHPGEAYHGDLGMISRGDLVLLISYSGETDEVIKLLPYLRHIDARSVSITGCVQSTLASASDVHLDVSVARECCPNNLAPTTSTTATLVMGDALAVALMGRRGFMPIDFARFHPGGSLGRKLLTRAEEVMHPVPCFSSDTPFSVVVKRITEGGLGVGCVTNEVGHLIGVVTDGDLRRSLVRPTEALRLQADSIMGRLPTVVPQSCNLYECEQLMRDRQLTSLIVVDGDQYPVGVIKSFDA